MDTILGFKEKFDDGKWQNDECYTEVRDDYVTENAEVRYIDAWKSDDDEVAGISAGVVINGIPYYRNCEAMTSPKVAEAVARYEIMYLLFPILDNKIFIFILDNSNIIFSTVVREDGGCFCLFLMMKMGGK